MKNLKNTLKDLCLSICCSFSVVVIANVFLADEKYAMSIGVYELRETFWICVITCLVVKIIGSINFTKEWMSYVFSFLGMVFSVFGLGTFVFHLIPLEFSVYLSVTIMLIVIYFICVSSVYAVRINEADAINEKLNCRTKIMKEERHGKDN